MNRYLILLLCITAVACSQQKKLHKKYVGKPETVLIQKFGNPKTIFDRQTGKIYVFEKDTVLRSTEISQAKLTLDPIISPSVKKTQRMYFTVKEGKITDVKLEEEYIR